MAAVYIFAAMPEVVIEIVNKSTNPLPAYATQGAAGMDIRANLDETFTLAPMQRAAIATGLFIALPNDYEAQIRPRSGLAINYGLTCLNSPGTIDADYRGEIKIILINLGNENVTISNGMRIAQMVVTPVSKAFFKEVSILNETERDDGGFGSTGK